MLNVEKSIRLKKELDALRPLNKEDELRIMQKFRLDWNYHSNHLEGNSLTYGETKALILFNITAQGKPLKDHIEVTGHDEAIKWITDIVKQKRPLTENFIRELHKLILKEPYERKSETPDGKIVKRKIKIGEYKTTPNHVRTQTGEMFWFATPEETPAKMNDLLTWYRKKIGDEATNSILLAAEFHYRFIRIHPFDDGNGRTARILMNFILMQFGYPPVIIKTEDKLNYFSVLQQADAGLLEPFIEYIAKNLNHSLEIMIKGAKGESIEEPDDLDKEIALLEQKFREKGTKIEVVKSKETLETLFQEDLKAFVITIISYFDKFKSFYIKSPVTIWKGSIGSTIKNLSGDNTIDTILNQVHEAIIKDPDHIGIECNFQIPDNSNVKPFNYLYRIDIFFSDTRYKVENKDSEWSFVRFYNETLYNSDVESLLQNDARKHKTFIEQKIKEHKKQ